MDPVTTGSLIQRSFVLFRAGFVPFFTLALIFYAPVAALQMTMPGAGDAEPVFDSSWLLIMLAHMLLIPIAAAAVVYGVFQGLRGRPATIGLCISVAGGRWLAILTLAVLTGLVSGVGYLLCVIPGFVLTCGLFVAAPVLIVESMDPIAAMKRSWELTDGYKLTLFFLSMAIALLQMVAGTLLNLAFGFGPMGSGPMSTGLGLYQIILTLVTVAFTAFSAIAAGVAYHDLRSFREGLGENELVAIFD